MKIMIGSDHHGVPLRLMLDDVVRNWGHEVIDVGPQQDKPVPVDYPDIASVVAQGVSEGKCERGILICGTGIGMCIAANKFPGVRAAPVNDEFSAERSRRHNDLNVLCLSADMLAPEMIEHLVQIWLDTPFEGGRHTKRLNRIAEIERNLIEKGKK